MTSLLTWFLPLLLQSFPEELILVYTGLVLTGNRIARRRLIVIAAVTALLSDLLRLWLPFPSVTLVMAIMMIITLRFVGRFNWLEASAVILLGLFSLVIVETISAPIITAFTGRPVAEMLQNFWYRILLPWPHMLALLLAAEVCRRRGWYLRLFQREE